MTRIMMKTPLVEMDGDEMTRVLWKMIKDELIEPFVELKSEYYIPFAVNTFIANGTATMTVLKTTAQWFGVTYKEDRPMVVERLKKLHDQGVY